MKARIVQKAIFATITISLFSTHIAFSAENNQSPNNYIASQGPQNAPITIIQFSDFQCPFCARALPVAKRILKEYPGRVRWVFKNYPLHFHKDALLAHEAALAAGEQGKFWEMHDLIFANQTRMKRSHLLEYAGQLNLDIEKFTASIESGRYKSIVENDIEEGKSLGVEGIPSFFVNGKKMDGLRPFVAFKAVIDEALVVASSNKHITGGKPLPLSVSIANSPVRGLSKAPITIIEFSDFQSPLCAEVVPLIDQVMEKYSGKVKLVFKHNPQGVTQAHEAAFAAGEQGKFWEMRDLIFKNHSKTDDIDYILYATQLGLDMDRFMADLNSAGHQARIEQDKAHGKSLGVSDTPTFFVNGKKLVGARSSSVFEAIIEEELSRLGQTTDVFSLTPSMATTGPTDAPVQIMVFSDFQSPLSANTAWLLKSLSIAYPDQMRLQFRHYPLEFHQDARLAHEAALAAGKQGKFWEMHDLIFANPGKLDKDQLITYASLLKLEMDNFKSALEERKYQALLQRDIIQGKRLGVRGVPTLLINGTRLDGTQSVARLKTLIETELKQERSCQG